MNSLSNIHSYIPVVLVVIINMFSLSERSRTEQLLHRVSNVRSNNHVLVTHNDRF